MDPSPHQGRRALAALAALARGSMRPPSPADLERGLAAVRARVNARKATPGSPVRDSRSMLLRWSIVGGLAATAAILAMGVVGSRRTRASVPGTPPALTYRVEGGSVGGGGYLRESGRDGIKLLFDEGTQFILMPGTRSRLRAVDASGARIAIEQGTASFQVTPTPNGERRWQVDVGPFLVTVKGTVFTVSWDATTEKFELKLRRGRVTVSGPLSGGELLLQAGQRLAVDLPRGETVINDQKPEDSVGSLSARAPRPVETPPERLTAASDRPGPVVGKTGAAAPYRPFDGDRAWAAALAAGQLDRILGEAEQAGVRATLDQASSDDLLALADAARYRRRMELAREALLAERRRFPDSPRALDAAFLLGRVEEANDHGQARALEWYDEYLTRAPTGTYASEALGRKMTLTSKLGGTSRVRPIAEEYLRRFPSGTYAGPARTFARAP